MTARYAIGGLPAAGLRVDRTAALRKAEDL